MLAECDWEHFLASSSSIDETFRQFLGDMHSFAEILASQATAPILGLLLPVLDCQKRKCFQ